MKIRSGRAVAAILAATSLALLAGCSTSSPVADGGASGGTADCKVGMLPKTTADANFQAMAEGGKEAADELGYAFEFNGPTTLDSAGQIQFIEQWTRQQFCGIAISANDPDALLPAIKSAQDAGVKVITFDAAVNDEDVIHLSPFTAAAMGEALTDELIGLTSESAKVYVLTSTLTAPNQSSWIEEMQKLFAADHPNAEIQAVQPGQGDVQQSFATAKAWLEAHPETEAVAALDASAVQGAAEAITSLGLEGKVKLTGIGVPSLNGQSLKDGVASSFYLYDSPLVGNAAIQILGQAIDGNVEPGDKTVDAGDAGTLDFISENYVLLGPPLKFTIDNVDDYNF